MSTVYLKKDDVHTVDTVYWLYGNTSNMFYIRESITFHASIINIYSDKSTISLILTNLPFALASDNRKN